MSSSKKKQLRNEQQLTERQRAAAKQTKEAKQLRAYTLTFWVVIGLVLAIFVGAVSLNPVKNLIYKNTDAIQVGDHTLSSVEANYFYIDAINDYVNQYSSYISYILDTTKPLNQQVTDKETGKTWADGFLDMAKATMKSTYALYDEAMKNNFKLTDEQQKSVDTLMSNLDVYASLSGYKNASAYLRAVYGNGASKESYKDYYTVCTIADAYFDAHSDSLEYTDADLRAFEAGSAFQYNSYTYASYYLSVTSFCEGGTKDEKGNITYSEAEKKAAREKILAIADKLAAGEYSNVLAFDEAISAAIDEATKDTEIDKNKIGTSSVKFNDKLYSAVDTKFQDWIIGKVEPVNEGDEPTYVERKEGELTVIPYITGTGENEVINGYYVVRFESINDNNYALKNVRHILVSFEGGTKDSNGNVTYSDAEKAAAKVAAEKLLQEWKDGAMTEESFAELAKKNSTDPGSKDNGGLYEDIYPGQMVTAFNDWCFDEERQVGDTGLVETDYGYHVMFFSGNSETLFRDYMVTNAHRSSDLNEWQNGLVEAIKLDELNIKHIKMDLVLSSH